MVPKAARVRGIYLLVNTPYRSPIGTNRRTDSVPSIFVSSYGPRTTWFPKKSTLYPNLMPTRLPKITLPVTDRSISSPNRLSCAAAPSSPPMRDPPRRALPSRSLCYLYLDRDLRRQAMSFLRVEASSGPPWVSADGHLVWSREFFPCSGCGWPRQQTASFSRCGSGSSHLRWPHIYQYLIIPSRCAFFFTKASCRWLLGLDSSAILKIFVWRLAISS
jgi:hypothetical protein